MTRILIVEDDPKFRRTLELNLVARGHVVDTTGTAEDALIIAGRKLPELVLLDLGLPGLDGMEVIRGLRLWSSTPIIVLSARGAEADKVDALDAGANDYLTKPFGIDELLARIRAVLRSRLHESGCVVRTATLIIDLDQSTVRRVGEAVRLTPIEWGLLAHLVRAEGQLVARETLLQAVWGPEYLHETNYLRVHMTHLRSKLEDDPSEPRYLITEPGRGYRFVRDPG